MRVLLVEDDDRVVAALTPALRRAHLTVTRAGTAAEALSAVPGADLVLLDMGLPDQDGLSVCRRIRAEGDVPIIAVTARRDEPSVVSALRAGVDDYVTKPYRLAELMARIDAVMRRSGHGVPESLDHVADVRLDLGARRVWAGEVEVTLTRKEFDLLSTLIDAGGDAVTRESLMESIWDTSWVGASRTLDVHVSALRTKLDRPRLIETVRGVGYRINAQG
ncbi:response regulator transcription factor [Janibacter sp. G349]|uniref:response regulator transcription factor n=1 Tax=unclassified Janibacter TaxID=2649294 RepID=UPI0020CEC969|nr:response regulator transcription factor [Janibacter sp. CX7]UTT65566.1 response regulator transcription factor [Janibacter sp. CX7]